MGRWGKVSLFCRLALVGSLVQSFSPAQANEARQLWYITSSLGLHTTEDEVRNNAAKQGDPRPGEDEGRTAVVDDGLSFSLSAGFGLTSHLAFQLDTGWFRGDVGPVDGFLADRFPAPGNPQNPTALSLITNRTTSFPTMAGSLTQIPVSLSLMTRFRKDTRLNPFLGAGLGMIFTDVEADEELEALNERIAALRVREIYNEQGGILTSDQFNPLKAQGRLPASHLFSIRTDDAFEWHLTGGLEYFLGDRWSFVASSSYIFTDGAVEFLAAGEDQVSFLIFSESLFREDGSLKVFNNIGVFPNPYIDPLDPGKGLVKCTPNTVGDFDHDGHSGDRCYRNNSLDPGDDPDGRLEVQGGRIEYGGFVISLGVRFYF
ncbi:MAG: hypothetical protein ACREAA_11215 [Candidatus Polarisedimenticolia bacterium]